MNYDQSLVFAVAYLGVVVVAVGYIVLHPARLGKSKKKRCKDCKWLFSENFESLVGYGCRKGMIENRFTLYHSGCEHYTRKRWKFWRSK